MREIGRISLLQTQIFRRCVEQVRARCRHPLKGRSKGRRAMLLVEQIKYWGSLYDPPPPPLPAPLQRVKKHI